MVCELSDQQLQCHIQYWKICSLYRDQYISDDTLTIDYYVMAYNLERAKKMFKQVKPMLESFEKNFGKYPFKRDGFTLLESIYPMEHQSGVCIGKITAENSGDTNPAIMARSLPMNGGVTR